ncbi:sigma-70 family RNA polymerase sigma factor [Gallaecimonas kandeliae]|uniref:sigma-70 family RNA polymerase sigma factor n=1 Tax=Gallaecimonas kandeliae TaxID=3029055 RepID=UPI00264A37F2|nr:sigma-70 family RNA polymerase sigma factor [Gallaecimonas kandeliae]WKE64008.1 sigma-70 family RNA polymerase sigma factor [Gallaecimonas kandeliae]
MSTDPLANDLAEIANRRCKQAFRRVFTYFAPRLKAFGFKQFGNEQQALELVQETLLTLWNKAHLYDPDKAAVTTWVYRVARNQSFDMMRRKAARPDTLAGDHLWPLENQSGDDPELDQQVLGDQALACLAILPPAQRQVIEKIYVQDKTQQETADELGVPLGTVKSRVRLALERLKEHLGSED